jgi:hypothetical protein
MSRLHAGREAYHFQVPSAAPLRIARFNHGGR